VQYHRAASSSPTEYRKETVYLKRGPELLKDIQKRIAASEPLPRGQYYALKVGEKNTFLSNHTKTLQALMNYAKHGLKFTGGELEQYMAQQYTNLVLIEWDSGNDSEQGKMTELERSGKSVISAVRKATRAAKTNRKAERVAQTRR